MKATERVGNKNSHRRYSRGLQFSLSFILSQHHRVLGSEDRVGHISAKERCRNRSTDLESNFWLPNEKGAGVRDNLGVWD